MATDILTPTIPSDPVGEINKYDFHTESKPVFRARKGLDGWVEGGGGHRFGDLGAAAVGSVDAGQARGFSHRSLWPRTAVRKRVRPRISGIRSCRKCF